MADFSMFADMPAAAAAAAADAFHADAAAIFRLRASAPCFATLRCR